MPSRSKVQETANGPTRPDDPRGWWNVISNHVATLLKECGQFPIFVLLCTVVGVAASSLSKPENMWGVVWIVAAGIIAVGVYLFFKKEEPTNRNKTPK